MQMAEQIDLFGGSIPVVQVAKKSSGKLSIKERFRMHYGFNHDHTCKDCKFLISKKRDRTYYKCSLMGITNSEATDIRLKDVACNAWLRKEE